MVVSGTVVHPQIIKMSFSHLPEAKLLVNKVFEFILPRNSQFTGGKLRNTDMLLFDRSHVLETKEGSRNFLFCINIIFQDYLNAMYFVDHTGTKIFSLPLMFGISAFPFFIPSYFCQLDQKRKCSFCLAKKGSVESF